MDGEIGFNLATQSSETFRNSFRDSFLRVSNRLQQTSTLQSVAEVKPQSESSQNQPKSCLKNEEEVDYNISDILKTRGVRQLIFVAFR